MGERAGGSGDGEQKEGGNQNAFASPTIGHDAQSRSKNHTRQSENGNEPTDLLFGNPEMIDHHR